MDENIVDDVQAAGIETATYWSYIVDQEGSNLVFSFRTRPFVRRIRHHTSPSYFPLIDVDMSQGDRRIVAPGQWLEGLIDGRWSFLSDADNR